MGGSFNQLTKYMHSEWPTQSQYLGGDSAHIISVEL